MLIAALLSPATAGALDAARVHGEIAWSSVRQRDGPATTADLEAAARTPADVLLLDAGAGPPDALLAGARQYRVTRPETRVILLAPGRVPGDPTVAGLVALGVYDILAPTGDDPNWEDLLHDTLTGPPATYAHAARWHAPSVSVPDVRQPAPERVRIVERIERVPLGGRPLVIAVAATASGLGATHLALVAARFLAHQGYRVGLVEAAPRPCLAALFQHESRPTGGDPPELVPGLRVYHRPPPAPALGSGTNLRADGLRLAQDLLATGRDLYEYLLLDLGETSPDEPELARADLVLLVHSPAPWRRADLDPWLGDRPPPSHWRLVVTPAGDVLDHAVDLPGVAAAALPWCPLRPDSVLPDAVSAALAQLLEPVLLRPAGPLPRRIPWAAHFLRAPAPALVATISLALAYLAAAWVQAASATGRIAAWAGPGVALLRAFGLVQ